MEEIDYVADPASARSLAERLAGHGHVCVDTEFVREKTYSPLPCLMQVAAGGRIAVVDLLEVGLDGALGEFLFDPGITKVLHAARQDLELFYLVTGRVPAPLFDTQVAGALTGLPEQCGYSNAVEKILGVQLGKSHARTDWSRRPLSPAQIHYAADDVRYLEPLYQALHERLAALGRADWPTADLEALTDPGLYTPDPDNAWLRVKGFRQLQGVALARLQALAAWREREAVARDRPRKWIVGDESLLWLAERNPLDIGELADCPGLPPAVLRRRGPALLQVLAEVEKDVDPVQPVDLFRPSPEENRLLTRLGRLVDRTARELGVAGPSLATRAELRKLVAGARDLPVLQGWRRDVLGEALLAAVGEADAETGDDQAPRP